MDCLEGQASGPVRVVVVGNESLEQRFVFRVLELHTFLCGQYSVAVDDGVD